MCLAFGTDVVLARTRLVGRADTPLYLPDSTRCFEGGPEAEAEDRCPHICG
jgi:hypothetical protein